MQLVLQGVVLLALLANSDRHMLHTKSCSLCFVILGSLKSLKLCAGETDNGAVLPLWFARIQKA